jgi:hypothetical protein
MILLVDIIDPSGFAIPTLKLWTFDDDEALSPQYSTE